MAEVIVRVATSRLIPMELETLEKVMQIEGLGGARFLPKPWQGVGAVAVFKPEGLPFGVEFKDADSDVETVIQSDLVASRWTAVEPGSKEYVGYTRLANQLESLVKTLQTSSVYEGEFRACNMSYISLVETDGPPSTSHVTHYFKGLLPECADNSEVFHEINVSWQKSDVDFRVQINRLVSSEGAHGLRVSTTAGHILRSKEIGASLTKNHESLEKFFPTLLTDQAKEDWGFNDGPA